MSSTPCIARVVFALAAAFWGASAPLHAAAPHPLPLPERMPVPPPVRMPAPLPEHAYAPGPPAAAPDPDSRFSLWGRQGDGRIHPIYQGMATPRRRITEGDIVHIMVHENSTASVTANTDLRRRVEADAKLKEWLHLKDFAQLVPGLQQGPLGIDFQSDRRTQGLGSRNRRDQMSFRIAAKVVTDLGDGTLFITAKKVRHVHDEKTELTLSGYVRREDISSNRLVMSERVHDLKLAYTGSGMVTSNYTRSIWTWLLDLLWF